MWQSPIFSIIGVIVAVLLLIPVTAEIFRAWHKSRYVQRLRKRLWRNWLLWSSGWYGRHRQGTWSTLSARVEALRRWLIRRYGPWAMSRQTHARRGPRISVAGEPKKEEKLCGV